MRYALERLRGDVTVLQQRVSTPNSADLAPGNPAAPPGSPKPVPDSLLAVFSSFSCSFRYCFLSGWDRHFASFFFCFSSVFLLFTAPHDCFCAVFYATEEETREGWERRGKHSFECKCEKILQQKMKVL